MGAKIGAVNNDNGKAVVWDTNGDCIVAGNFGGSLTIGSLAAISAAGSGISSQYVARFDGLSTGLTSFDSGIAFEVYPNPAHDFITVITSETMPISNYEIYGVNGALLLSDQMSHRTSEIKLNVSDLKPGIYFLHITSGEEKGIKKIQVN
ncbi:MAG: T9SS type A sorting domain-containing protein [Bacteroidetes bacterium]|nr:T9SS type A sorting domain-containing protein [Bacteroidota bacterium]